MITRIILLSAVLLAPFLHAAEPPIEDLLRQGLFEEEANRDFTKAAERYRAVVAANDKQRALAATATYRLGEIARKENDKEAAAKAFRTVLERFPEQSDLVRLSKENLTILGMPAGQPGETIAGEAPGPGSAAEDPQEAEIARLKDIARNSPDLLDGSDSSGWRPLHTAARNGWVKVISYLLENKVDINSRTTGEQFTPLQIASIYGHLGAVNALVAGKADLNASFLNPEGTRWGLPTREQRAEDLRGDWRALDLAILYDRKEITRALIKAGAGQKLAGGMLNGMGEAMTPLMMAIYLGRNELAADLISAGSPLDLVPGTSMAPLHVAVLENPGMVVPLLKAGAKVELGGRLDDWTALHMAAARDRVEMAGILIDAGADVKRGDKNGETAMHLASTVGMFELLVSKGADPNAKAKDGTTPLDKIATRNGRKEEDKILLEALLKLGAKTEDPAALLRKTSPDMLPFVRELLVYPAIYQEDSIQLSLEWGEPSMRLAEKRIAAGSPPPSVAEVLALIRGVTANPDHTNLERVAVVRRDAAGRFATVFETSSPGRGPGNGLPSELQWGDFVEVRIGAGFNPGKPVLKDWIDEPPARDVVYRFDGVSFPVKLTAIGEMWLGSPDVKNWIPRVQDFHSESWLPRSGQEEPKIRPLGDLPAPFMDPAKIVVKRKNVEQPLAVDLAGDGAKPFRLVEGDIIDFTWLPGVKERMEKENRVLFLTSNLKYGSLLSSGSLLRALSEIAGAEYDGLLDWKKVDVLGNTRDRKSVSLNVEEWLKRLPEGPVTAGQLAEVGKLNPGEWVIFSYLPRSSWNRDANIDFQLTSTVLHKLSDAPPMLPETLAKDGKIVRPTVSDALPKLRPAN